MKSRKKKITPTLLQNSKLPEPETKSKKPGLNDAIQAIQLAKTKIDPSAVTLTARVSTADAYLRSQFDALEKGRQGRKKTDSPKETIRRRDLNWKLRAKKIRDEFPGIRRQDIARMIRDGEDGESPTALAIGTIENAIKDPSRRKRK